MFLILEQYSLRGYVINAEKNSPIALSYPPPPPRAMVKLSAAFFHDESSITIGGYKSAIAPKKHLKKREILAFKPLLIQLKNLTGTERKDFLKLLTSKL